MTEDLIDRGNETSAPSQLPLEVARDLVFNLEDLKPGETLSLEVTTGGNNLFDLTMRSSDGDQSLRVGKHVGFELTREEV